MLYGSQGTRDHGNPKTIKSEISNGVSKLSNSYYLNDIFQAIFRFQWKIQWTVETLDDGNFLFSNFNSD